MPFWNRSPALRRLVAGLPITVFAALALSFGTDLPLALGLSVFAGLGVWILFPLFGRWPGLPGRVSDLFLCFAALPLGGAIAGTLVMPGVYTLLGAVQAATLPFGSAQGPLVSVICLGAFIVATAATLHMARK